MRKKGCHAIRRFPVDDRGLYTPLMIPASMRQALDNVAHSCKESRSAMIRMAIAELLERIYQARSNTEQSAEDTSNIHIDARKAA